MIVSTLRHSTTQMDQAFPRFSRSPQTCNTNKGDKAGNKTSSGSLLELRLVPSLVMRLMGTVKNLNVGCENTKPTSNDWWREAFQELYSLEDKVNITC